ncbi:hypothetical protein HKX02_15755 [Ochrobactrum soli]|uniref:Formate dehydrogenase F4B subunit n=2 Tax=Brucella/Ochrobactrum group TaxID=2826938 RepID=A0A849KSQ7_9HYPH|nr:hypothetical protein [[Ochrobactrum] soli]NNU61689.1 hypothetical protein [[Ochrobactrum] soli]
MMDEAAADYMALVERLVATSENLSPFGAGIIAALALGVAADSRTFGRVLGIEHALVLREVNLLGADGGYIRISQRDPRTQRTRYELSPVGRQLVDKI